MPADFDAVKVDTFCLLIYYLTPFTCYKKRTTAQKKELAKARMEKIQKTFADDKGWADEQEMISDLAEFRRSRKKG